MTALVPPRSTGASATRWELTANQVALRCRGLRASREAYCRPGHEEAGAGTRWMP
jgi:hypothetical protein